MVRFASSPDPTELGLRWHELEQVLEDEQRLQAQRQENAALLSSLNDQLLVAQERDKKAMTEALLNDEEEPQDLEAHKIQAELERARRRGEGIAGALDRLRDQLGAVVEEHEGEWRAELLGLLPHAQDQLEAQTRGVMEAAQRIDQIATLWGFLGSPDTPRQRTPMGKVVVAGRAISLSVFLSALTDKARRLEAREPQPKVEEPSLAASDMEFRV